MWRGLYCLGTKAQAVSMQPPEELRAGLDDLASSASGQLAEVARELSTRYGAGHGRSSSSYVRVADEIIAYALTRLPATYAAISAALVEVRARCPDWAPKTVLDVGAGPGTALWAAANLWPEIESATLIEREPGMIALG